MTTGKSSWYVIGIKTSDGKRCAYPLRIGNSSNLVGYAVHENVVSMNACDTKKEASRIADMWNQSAIEQGEYLY